MSRLESDIKQAFTAFGRLFFVLPCDICFAICDEITKTAHDINHILSEPYDH